MFSHSSEILSSQPMIAAALTRVHVQVNNRIYLSIYIFLFMLSRLNYFNHSPAKEISFCFL